MMDSLVTLNAERNIGREAMFKRIDHVEIVPRHFEKTIEFYMNILNFKLRERRKVAMPPLEEIVYLELNGTVVELMSVQSFPFFGTAMASRIPNDRT